MTHLHLRSSQPLGAGRETTGWLDVALAVQRCNGATVQRCNGATSTLAVGKMGSGGEAGEKLEVIEELSWQQPGLKPSTSLDQRTLI